MFAMTATSAEAEDVKIPSQAVRPVPRAIPAASQAAKSSGTVEVAVDEGARGTRLYRFDRGSGTLTLVKQLSQKEAPSSISRFKDLQTAERAAPVSNVDKGGAVSPEGKPPKGGPPGGHDPGLITQADFAALSRELARLKVEKSQVKIGTIQQAQSQVR
ncbi:hypothetical protein D7V93_14170 [Corallococcus llansteffanensis]|uniref:Uncharacterized protein n=1 Tax=Corallococcus llansteffanensis TaxID=2316731 RepID=A0A3A8PTQ3_9BACT|nr:hypothetical protein D7V93_14170 [Corallococcus llansteffanensis]